MTKLSCKLDLTSKPNRQSEWELDINTWFLENVGSASTKELAIKFYNLLIVVEQLLASYHQKLKGEVEGKVIKNCFVMGELKSFKAVKLSDVIKLLGE